MAKFRRLIVGLPIGLDNALRARAAEEDCPLSWLIRKALREYLNTPEDEYRWTPDVAQVGDDDD